MSDNQDEAMHDDGTHQDAPIQAFEVPPDLVTPPQEVSIEEKPVEVQKPGKKEEVSEVDLLGIANTPELARYREPAKNVTQDREIYIDDGEWDDGKPRVALPSLPGEVLDQVISKFPNLQDMDRGPGWYWMDIIKKSSHMAEGGAAFQKAVDNEDTDWGQLVSIDGNNVGPRPLKFSTPPGAKLTGERALFKAQSILGVGGVHQFPLWHSGFYVTLRAPTEAALLELNRRLSDEKIRIGRQTTGAAYSNQSVFFAAQIMEFVLEHVYRTTLADQTDFRKLIDIRDVHLLALGLASVVYPRGFQFVRAVVGDEANPTRTIQQKINPLRMLWVDRSKLTQSQLNHMSKRNGSEMTAEQVQAYQDEFAIGRPKKIILRKESEEGAGDALSMTFYCPKMDDYLNAGERWINNLVASYDKVSGHDSDVERRNSHIARHATAVMMRQYGHWVKSITIGDEEVDDQETIDSLLDMFSTDENVLNTFLEEVDSYIGNSAMAISAVTTHNEHDKSLPSHPHLFPVDPLSTFFILLVQRVGPSQTQ